MTQIFYRLGVTICNIFFPPLAVMILTGFDMDLMVNSLLFLCAVISSHVHGFYISCVYFHRRKKVKKGIYPGGPKPFIYSDKVINGGANNREVERLLRKQKGLERGGSRRSTTSRSNSRGEMVQRMPSNASYANGRSGVGRHASTRSRRSARPAPQRSRTEERMMRDGYGAAPGPRREYY